MISISKDSLTIQVTKGAYNQIYKPLGWVELGEDEKMPIENESFESDEANIETVEEDEEFEEENSSEAEGNDPEDDELLETPLSDMNVTQMYKYAKLMEIELEEGLNKKQAREAIRAALQ